MSLIKRNPTFYPTINTLFDEWFDRAFPRLDTAVQNTLPAVNIRENDTEFTIDVAVPGMKKDDIKVELNHNVLSISSETKTEKNEKDEKGRWARREFNYQSFKRTFTLPEDGVDAEKIEASHNDGVLTIRVPKRVHEAVETRKLIEIK
jgi:HSP20 family protein